MKLKIKYYSVLLISALLVIGISCMMTMMMEDRMQEVITQ